ncbi:MAG TPA: T9SS type A sorting domain-containing protein [Edaphocola sp.]|nr:T9SS type A sorting domain-containing protein [Edaphocola sp.]
MKKTFLISIALCIGVFYAQAQTQKRFEVTMNSGVSYQTLSTAATELPFTTNWDDEISDPIPFPFPFKYQNETINTVIIETDGSLYFNNYDVPSVSGISMDYESKGRGKVLYETVGTTGNHIFKVEYRDIGRYDDSTSLDTVNFQIWLYEFDNSIEYHVGFNNITADKVAHDVAELMSGLEPVITAVVGNEGNYISENEDSLFFHFVSMNSGQLSDTIIYNDELNNNAILYLEKIAFGDFPANKSVIRFSSLDGGNTGIKDIKEELATIFPNPSQNGIYNIELKNNLMDAVITVYDLNGRIILKQPLTEKLNKISLQEFSAGQYKAIIQSKNYNESFTLVKE